MATTSDETRTETEPTSWAEVLLAECQQLDPTFDPASLPPTTDPLARLDALHRAAFAHGHAALCLSGGGIRSASFAVGVLQTFARHDALAKFDYLSTVSGGGFAGAWLSAWLARAARVASADDLDAEREVRAARDAVTHLTEGLAPAGHVEPWPVTRLRQFTRYLNPQSGVFSADFWGLVVTMLRNLLLNWTVTVPLLAAALLVPRVHYSLIHLSERDLSPEAVFRLFDPETIPLALGWLGHVVGLAFVIADLPSYGNRRRSQYQFILRVLLPISLGTLALTYFWALNQIIIPTRTVILATAVSNATVWMVVGFFTGHRPFRPRTWFAGAVSGAVAGAGMGVLINVVWADPELHKMYITFAFPAVLACILLGIVAMIGIASNEITQADIEWWSRCGAWTLIVIVGWIAVCGVVFGGPWLVAATKARIPSADNWLAVLTPALGAVGAWLARPHAGGQWSILRRIGLAIAAPGFVLLLLVGLAYADDEAVRGLATWSIFRSTDPRIDPNALPVCPRDKEDQAEEIQCLPAGAGLEETLSLGLCLVLIGFGASRFIAANKFSLHGMYRQRLTRTFLGASRIGRQPNPFTGFDPGDDIEMTALAGQRPFHVVNVTLNRRVDSQLGRQQRRAESFTFSPLYVGNPTNGYRPTAQYAYDASQRQSVTLGSAMTVSGAAASPAMGEFSTSSLAFLLTLLNARLGAWFGNPGHAGRDTWQLSDPKAGVGPIIRELLGLTTTNNPYVYLSDGGHFDNLGLWEMVLRRCKYIVVIDAGCDPDFTLTDLAAAVRKVRIDHGVRIELDPLDESRGPAPSHPHVMTGIIRYADGARAMVGRLIYIKPTVSGDEPVDVLHYKKAFPLFPHESTADQWFSEAQFESYRMLGVHSAEVALAQLHEGALGSVLREIDAEPARRSGSRAPSPSAGV